MRPDIARIPLDASYAGLGIPGTLSAPGGTPSAAVTIIDDRRDARLSGDGLQVNTQGGRFKVRVYEPELVAALAAAGVQKPLSWVLVVQTSPATSWTISQARIEDPARLEWTLSAGEIR